jgi:DNA-binding NarL/FixJ family response regulator
MLTEMGWRPSLTGLTASLPPLAKPPASAPSPPQRPADGAREPLTLQEAQVARLAREGLSSLEIAARLLITPNTVKYHPCKVFTKLGITARGQLHRVFPPP